MWLSIQWRIGSLWLSIQQIISLNQEKNIRNDINTDLVSQPDSDDVIKNQFDELVNQNNPITTLQDNDG